MRYAYTYRASAALQRLKVAMPRGSDRYPGCDRASRGQAAQAERRLEAHPGPQGREARPAQAAGTEASRKTCRCC
jgi:hypothetical protein